MTEEEVSVALFSAASEDDDIEVLSWQSIDGKNYFAFDIKLRLPNSERMEPDLVVRSDLLWLIEVKGLHSEAAEDEAKLVRLLDELGPEEVQAQIYRRAGIFDREVMEIELAVAFGEDDLRGSSDRCEPRVRHIDWFAAQALVERDGLSASLRRLTQV
jgi:hypothetical protein